MGYLGYNLNMQLSIKQRIKQMYSQDLVTPQGSSFDIKRCTVCDFSDISTHYLREPDSYTLSVSKDFHDIIAKELRGRLYHVVEQNDAIFEDLQFVHEDSDGEPWHTWGEEGCYLKKARYKLTNLDEDRVYQEKILLYEIYNYATNTEVYLHVCD